MTTLFLETDIHDDVDDVGALAVAHALAQAGITSIAGINVNTDSVWGPRVVTAINRYYASPVPIGAMRPSSETLGPQEFARGTSRLFGTDRVVDTHDPVALLRTTLAAASRGSITLVSLGFFDNLVGLLRSGADAISDRPGVELVRRAVGRAVVMGGVFGRDGGLVPGEGEYNFSENGDLTAEFLRTWPTAVDFVGWETGHDVVTGRDLLDRHGRESPVAAAYQLHSGYRRGRPSWDLIAVLLAVYPDWDAFSWSPRGEVGVDMRAASSWRPDPDGAHRYAVRRASAIATASRIDEWLCLPSRDRSEAEHAVR